MVAIRPERSMVRLLLAGEGLMVTRAGSACRLNNCLPAPCRMPSAGSAGCYCETAFSGMPPWRPEDMNSPLTRSRCGASLQEKTPKTQGECRYIAGRALGSEGPETPPHFRSTERFHECVP